MSNYSYVYIQLYECFKVLYLIFLPMFLVYFVILYNQCFFFCYNHFVSVKVYLYFFHNIFFVDLIFYLCSHSNVIYIVTMRTKIKCRINKKYIMKKIEMYHIYLITILDQLMIANILDITYTFAI